MKLLRRGAFPQEGLPPTVSFMSFDGRVGYFVDYVPGSATKIRSIHQTPRINSNYHDLLSSTPAVFYGHRFPFCAGGLLDFLKSTGTVVVGRETIEAASCVHLQAPRHVGSGEAELKVDVWLDEKMDWLPRRIVVRFLPTNQKVSARFRDVDWRYDVRKFTEVPDTLLGKKRKFPSEMIAEGVAGNWRLRVAEAQINARLPEGIFRPNMRPER